MSPFEPRAHTDMIAELSEENERLKAEIEQLKVSLAEATAARE